MRIQTDSKGDHFDNSKREAGDQMEESFEKANWLKTINDRLSWHYSSSHRLQSGPLYNHKVQHCEGKLFFQTL